MRSSAPEPSRPRHRPFSRASGRSLNAGLRPCGLYCLVASIGCIVPLLFLSCAAGADEATPEPLHAPEPANHFEVVVRPKLVEYCGECHDPDDEDNVVGFLRAESADQIGNRRSLWASVSEQLRNRTMPPADETQPAEAERLELAIWIDEYLESTACEGGESAGNPVPRRLNRDQYGYAIADLTGVQFDFAQTFPGDGGGGEGFDNNGETLFLPPLLMERYLEVAQQIIDHVVVVQPAYLELTDRAGEADASPENTWTDDPTDNERSSRPGWLVVVNVEADFGLLVEFADALESGDQRSIWVDGLMATEFDRSDMDGVQRVWMKIHLAGGPHHLEVRGGDADSATIDRVRLMQLPGVSGDEETADETRAKIERRFERSLADGLLDSKRGFRQVYDEVAGEFNGDVVQERQQAMERLLRPAGVDRHAPATDPAAARRAAKRVLGSFARRAWRHTVSDEELDRLMALYDRGVERDEAMRPALKLPLQAVLVSPNFLFIVERTPAEPGLHRIDDLELAARLSMFLWHSLPDDELIELAEAHQLHQPKVLKAQVRRMLADQRSKRYADAFAGQWFGTVAVGNTVIPDTNFFKPAYTSELVTDLRRQVGELMHWMLQQNRPVTEWLDADYVIVNERLAEHYGFQPGDKQRGKRRDGNRYDKDENDDETDRDDDQDDQAEEKALVSGEGFVCLPIDGIAAAERRPGVLGLGAVHMLTSYSRRTSPVLRGGWVLETMFGTHLPAPPPDVPDLPGGEKEDKAKTVRQRLEKHRENATCAACHDLIDPVGFALENFDVLGRWREQEGELPIDAKGEFPSGESFTGPVELRQLLLARQSEFIHVMCERMLGFALGRSLEDADSCTVSRLANRLAAHDNRIEELVFGIVESVPFQFRSGVGPHSTDRPSLEPR